MLTRWLSAATPALLCLAGMEALAQQGQRPPGAVLGPSKDGSLSTWHMPLRHGHVPFATSRRFATYQRTRLATGINGQCFFRAKCKTYGKDLNGTTVRWLLQMIILRRSPTFFACHRKQVRLASPCLLGPACLHLQLHPVRRLPPESAPLWGCSPTPERLQGDPQTAGWQLRGQLHRHRCLGRPGSAPPRPQPPLAPG